MAHSGSGYSNELVDFGSMGVWDPRSDGGPKVVIFGDFRGSVFGPFSDPKVGQKWGPEIDQFWGPKMDHFERSKMEVFGVLIWRV